MKKHLSLGLGVLVFLFLGSFARGFAEANAYDQATATKQKPADANSPQSLPNPAAEKVGESITASEPIRDPYAIQQQLEKAREERKKRIQEAIINDKSVLATKRSPLDFSNNALTLGEPFLGLGPFRDYGLTWFGEDANAVRPRAQFYGMLREVTYGGRINRENQGQIGYTLDAEFNFELTNTERFHVTYTPFVDVNEPQASGLWKFHNESKTDDHNLKFTEDTLGAWFEGEIGEMFNFFSPRDRAPTDYHVAGGLLPLAYQNGFLMNDNVWGVLLSKPNIILPGTTNVHAQIMAAFDEINAATTGARDDNDAQLYGATVQIDSFHRFFELNYFHLENTVNPRLSQDFVAGSMASNYELAHYAVRMLFNVGDKRASGTGRGDGQLYAFDINYPVFNSEYFDKNYVYATLFYGTEGWNDMAKGRTGRAGILYQGNGLTSFPGLRNTGTDSIGMAYGLKTFFLRESLAINPEFSYLVDNSATANDQYALGVEIQYILTKNIASVVKMIGIHNDIRNEDWGSSAELRYKF
ncbi:MAG: hypothetical protein HY579_13305 [Nitrospinae bacterium]|nr:hypothetical protein [Nitrospinota bacterium]